MTTTKARCSVCGEYVLRADMYRTHGMTNWCSPACLSEQRTQRREQDKKLGVRRSHGVPRKKISPSLRKTIFNRDKQRCRFCLGRNLVEIHHIEYRSQGGPDKDWNLILLCKECHMTVHSVKHRYQPLLRGVIWMHYAERKFVTVPQLERWLNESR